MGHYDPHLLLLLSIGGVAGSVAGSMLAGRIAQRPLRVGLLIVLIALGTQLCYRGISQNVAAREVAQPKVAALQTAR
jgi:uncharacterized membrane protein YfcA